MLPRHTCEHADSFRSYIDAFRDDEDRKVVDGSPDFPLLKGEIVSSQCDDVVLYPPFRENLFGKLYCTNFRICFVPLAEEHRDPCCSRSLIFADDYQLPLCSVEAVHYASTPVVRSTLSSSKKFRPMTSPVSQLDIVSCIKIYTKEFRVWTFDLQRSQFAVGLTNNIYHFSRPTSLSNFFQLSCEVPSLQRPSTGSSVAFDNKRDWDGELERCKAKEECWQTLSLKGLFPKDLPQSYPNHVVVPRGIERKYIKESLIPNWTDGRFPIWCWSSSNGSALLRSSKYCGDNAFRDKEIISCLQKNHPANLLPETIDVDVTPTKISACYEKLRELCTIESEAQFTERDKEWYSLLDETGWCALVFECLRFAGSALKTLTTGRSIIIVDENGFDASAVVSSLVQICADSLYRTIAGLNKLIEKEWIALGHPFGINMFNCSFSSHVQRLQPSTATFLLFLDCLSQLIRLYPLSFEYSQYMLIALWDLSVTGLAAGLTCNTVSDLIALDKTSPTFPLSQYYSSKYCIMFTNVAYLANRLFKIEASSEVIRPPSIPLDIEFWTDCYLRWVPAANISDGGSITKDLTLCSVLANEASDVSPSCEPVAWRQRHHPAFDCPNVTSAFPYLEVATSSSNKESPSSETISVKSLRDQFERRLFVSSPTSKSVLAQRRFSASPLLSRVSEFVDSGREKRPRDLRSRLLRSSPTGTLV